MLETKKIKEIKDYAKNDIMIITLRHFLQELTFVQIPDIKRHAKGLLIALDKSNRKEMLEYEIKPINSCEHKKIVYGQAEWCENCQEMIDFQEEL